MRHGTEWYKRDPQAYLGGVQGLSAQEHAVYSVVLDLIYVHGGSVNNDPRWIAGWISDMGSASVRRTIDGLVERGKLAIEGDQLTQKRAKNEAKTKEKLRENRRKTGEIGGRKSAEIRSTSRKNNHLPEPSAKTQTQPEKRREEKNPPNPPPGGTDDLFPEQKVEGKPKPETPIDILSEILPHQTAQDFIDHRKALKKPLTVPAAKRAVTQLSKFKNPVASVDASIMNGWAGVFEPDRPAASGRSAEADRGSGLLDRVAKNHGDWR